ncbi:MAG: DUF1822 family protein [Phormidesmis sp. RL_2_1]|nr:DUF1822 family protein [Phormidesmis sp. RL_2_1]
MTHSAEDACAPDSMALPPAISIAIDPCDRHLAHQFAAQQPTAATSAQVYRNTLAVLMTQRYLQRLGIATTVANSQSWHPLARVIGNVADLYIPSLQGSLECRAIQAGDRTCFVPHDVHSDRLGYVVIQLDAPYQIAHLIGFVASVCVETLPLSYLHPLDELVGLFLAEPPEAPAIKIRQWLNHLFEPDWQPPADLLHRMGTTVLHAAPLARREDSLRQRLDNLYRQQAADLDRSLANQQLNLEHSDQATLAQLLKTTQNDNIRWQAAELLWEINPAHPDCPVMSAKDLGLYLNGHPVALAVGVLAKPDHTLLILTRLYPFKDTADLTTHLPMGLRLTGLDENDNTFFDIAARAQDNYIQFKFTADEGDRFSLCITLDEAHFTENFIV